jgi:hypothetical protein
LFPTSNQSPTGTTSEYEAGIDIDQTLVNGGAPGAGLTDGDIASIDARRLIETAFSLSNILGQSRGGPYNRRKLPEKIQPSPSLVICMVRRLTAREYSEEKSSLRKCIRPTVGDFSPALMMIRRVPVLDKAIGFGQPYTSPGFPARRSTVVSS